ncbi:PspC domain-containing protein [Nocardioides humilatus]|uniref:PspC domain-containing protein n=1 Tax=Nocardioides humilatus TaxID=2607660 RepID=A0A5B1LMF0_9ACTN|nr:PspC domain-containing protein [Nocardioides humilatus]KAA1421955.1 PspC domain-containing protein [Nocardioides humilatus]
MSNSETYPAPPPPSAPQAHTLLARSRQDRVVSGVCGGFADYTGWDANLIRIFLVAATVLGFGSPLIVYLAAWILMPVNDWQ